MLLGRARTASDASATDEHEISGLKQRNVAASKHEAPPACSEKASHTLEDKVTAVSVSLKVAARCKTVLALLFLWACSPLLTLLAFATWVRHLLFGPASQGSKPQKQLRILVTGGKMSKASAVARAVGRDGHKVFTAEIMPYQFCHTRFCRYVSKHYVLPRPTEEPEKWLTTMRQIVEEQSIDLIIPCTAPVESSAYAHLRHQLPSTVRVFAFDGETSDVLDNKYTFNQVLVKAGLPCPETAKMESSEDAIEFFKRKEESGVDDGKRYIVKPGVYDPKARTEILFLPIEDKAQQSEYIRSRNATKNVPYVIQEVLQNPEYGSYAIFNKGELTGFEFFLSAASCLMYRQDRQGDGKYYDAALELNRGLGKAMNLTGQLTLDFMHTSTGDLVPIECNPRIHSAVCTLEGHKNLGAILADPDFKPQGEAEVVKSPPEQMRFWLMDQLFLMAGFWQPKNCFKLSLWEMLGGNDAILCGDDPAPFLAMYLLQIPSLLVLELLLGSAWLKIDFCIGKIVKEGGD